MSELKRYDLYTSSQLYFIDGCPMYKCSDIDPILPVWVSVDERLPDDICIAFTPFVHSSMMYRIIPSGLFNVSDATHWMPLPPAPTA